ncbi:cell division protein FtsN [Bacillus coahuilensis m2-6]|uniref:CalY family protein n=1 Tax=Bacillus coahuilensis TaxID=408580 RepID=UPI0007505DC4|nr:CalY family protein [Bacillus coahuilensis]KUP05408.1 cell division protein FtsN [Bacillus coahuilensis m2-6]
MGIKQKLGLGVASAALGLSLVGGGTYAYFNDVETTNNTFAAGTLDLAVNPTTIIDVSNLKPGDAMYREFELQNNGSLGISSVDITTNYTVYSEGANSDDMGKHIMVHFLENEDKTAWLRGTGVQYNDVISSTTLYDLQNMTPDAVESIVSWWAWFGEDSGLPAQTSDDMNVLFEFVDNGKDQNEFQGDSLNLKWTFTANQEAGEER